ncbi:MAG TPA: SHOCT domain-containing protein [Thermoanaerobaculia bacterium]
MIVPSFRSVIVALTLLSVSAVYADCDPDVRGKDRITKQEIVQWQQVLTASGILSAALLEKDITFTAYVARTGDKNVVGVVVQKVEPNLARAAFETQFRAAKGDEIVLGFKNGGPITFITTKAGNTAQAGTFSGNLNMSASWEAEVSDADLAAHRDALTTGLVDAIRITAASGQIDRAIPAKNGQRLMEKFGCFFRALDSAGVSASGGQQSQSDAAGGVAIHRASTSSPLEAAVRSNANCRANFSVAGSMVRGTRYETYDDYPASEYTAGLSTVEAAIARAGLVIESTERTTGTLNAVGKSDRGKDIRYVFTVVPASGGVRVTAARDVRIGTHASDGAIRDEMCKVLSTIGEATAAVVPVKPASTAVAKTPQPAPPEKEAPETPAAVPATGVEERLRQLDSLFKKGVITEEEYKKKRAQILSSI